MKNKYYQKILYILTCICYLSLLVSSCKEEIQVLPKETNQLVISEFTELNEDFSEFNGVLVQSKLDNLLSIRGPYTLFLPNNGAMKAFYSSKGVNSYKELDSVTCIEFIYNHVIPREYVISDFQLGTLGTKNALGDNIVTEFQGPDIIINKNSKIVKRDIKVSNGAIHVLDRVIDPIKLSVYDKLASDPAYSIFAEGLKRTGIMDTLKVIEFPYGALQARTRYTILAIADSTFKRYGINNIDALIAKYTNRPDSIKFHGNGFYDYMDFHCLDRNAYYTSDFPQEATLYSVLSKNNNLQIRSVDEIFQISFNADDQSYTTFYIDQSNIPAKNGVIHTINTLLDVTTPAPTTIVWEVTDYFDFKQGEYYLNHFEKFYDPLKFQGIRWEGEYLQYYIKARKDAQAQLNDDCLNMIGFWTIEVTTPKFMKGKYRMAGRVWSGISFAVYIDGVQTNVIKTSDQPAVESKSADDNSSLYLFGDVNWTETKEHKVKLVALASNTLFWDRIELVPVK